MQINEASHVCYGPLVHDYSVITLDNWHHGPKITKQWTVNVCLYSN